MLHYRWAHEADARNAGPQLVFWRDQTIPEREAREAAAAISRRQIDRLHVVGSNPATAETIEQSFRRLFDLLDARISERGWIRGARRASCDFAIFGQLGVVEPTPAGILTARSSRLRAWIDRMEDLSGLDPQEDGWLTDLSALRPLPIEIGRAYAFSSPTPRPFGPAPPNSSPRSTAAPEPSPPFPTRPSACAP